ncbi:MAG: hypothetical protein ACUVTL_09415 [Thermoproteota archaeon]
MSRSLLPVFDYFIPSKLLKAIKEFMAAKFDLDALENWHRINPSELAAGDEAWAQQFVDVVERSGLKSQLIQLLHK